MKGSVALNQEYRGVAFGVIRDDIIQTMQMQSVNFILYKISIVF